MNASGNNNSNIVPVWRHKCRKVMKVTKKIGRMVLKKTMKLVLKTIPELIEEEIEEACCQE